MRSIAAAGMAAVVFLAASSSCRKETPATAGPPEDAVVAAGLVQPADAQVGIPKFSLAGSGPRPRDNSFCFVCHQGLSKESITTDHSDEGVLCVDCHGPSTLHMEDEMLMTKPDVLYGRNEVERLCRKCHGPHEDPVKVEAFREEWYGRDRSNGRVVNMRSICTDCHGEHNLAGKVENRTHSSEAHEAEWRDLLDGSDLTGWRMEGEGRWSVEGGAIEGRPGEAAGRLLTSKEYADFLLAVTYRVEWPCAAGIWLRRQSGEQGYRIEIVENESPPLYSGTLLIPGREPLAVSSDRELVDREGWNTIAVSVQGSRLEVFLNGHQVAKVEDGTFASGQIGFEIRPVSGGEAGRIIISEAKIQLAANQGPSSP